MQSPGAHVYPPGRAAGGLGRSVMLAFPAREMTAKIEGIEALGIAYSQGQNFIAQNGFPLIMIINPGDFFDLLASFGQTGSI